MFGFLESIFGSLILLLSYVQNSNSFPKPLTAAEEREYLERFQQGDVEAKNILIEHNLRLVAHVVKKYTPTLGDSEELISIGTIGLIKGISSFDPSKGTRLATYVARCVDNEILMLIRNRKKMQGDVSMNESIGTDKEGNSIMLMDVMGTEEEVVFDEIDLGMQVKQLYKNIKNELDDREKEVIVLRYGLVDGHMMTQREIAKRLNISRSYVSRIEKKAVGKLRKNITN